MPKLITAILALAFSFSLSAQNLTFEEVKMNENLMYGIGEGKSLRKADDAALQDLISQVYVQVESEFRSSVTEINKNGSADFEEYSQNMLNTYSRATLTQTERIVLEQGGEFKVCRYINRAKIAEIFKDRERKLLDFIETAQNAEKDLRIADAIKYNYWALVLLQSIPGSTKIELTNPDGSKDRVIVEIPKRLNALFEGLEAVAINNSEDGGHSLVTMSVTYKGQPVSNVDFTYWDGVDWSPIHTAKDGLGIMEFLGQKQAPDKVNMRWEYVQMEQSKIDLELSDVLEQSADLPFTKASIRFSTKSEVPKATLTAAVNSSTRNAVNNMVQSKEVNESAQAEVKIIDSPNEIAKYEPTLNSIISAIKSGNHESVRAYCTENGYAMYKDLIEYGRARVIGKPDWIIMHLHDEYVLRSLPMQFDFPSNNRKFVEDVNFIFDQNGKMDALSFSIGQVATTDILSKSQWPDADKVQLITFLEHYKTAYCLKRLDYIQSIFDDNALIIVGHVLKVDNNDSKGYQNHQVVKYNRYTKQQYIENLARLFKTKEFVNIQFEDNEVRLSREDHIYGIQIKQNYYSTNYADQGYLFLMVDLRDSLNPKIHVRTWQPEKNSDGSIYGLEDF